MYTFLVLGAVRLTFLFFPPASKSIPCTARSLSVPGDQRNPVSRQACVGHAAHHVGVNSCSLIWPPKCLRLAMSTTGGLLRLPGLLEAGLESAGELLPASPMARC